MLNQLTALAERARRIATLLDAPCYNVRLISRRTGEPHLVRGRPLEMVTCDPISASSQLMRNRDPELWDAFVQQSDRKGVLQ